MFFYRGGGVVFIVKFILDGMNCKGLDFIMLVGFSNYIFDKVYLIKCFVWDLL